MAAGTRRLAVVVAVGWAGAAVGTTEAVVVEAKSGLLPDSIRSENLHPVLIKSEISGQLPGTCLARPHVGPQRHVVGAGAGEFRRAQVDLRSGKAQVLTASIHLVATGAPVSTCETRMRAKQALLFARSTVVRLKKWFQKPSHKVCSNKPRDSPVPASCLRLWCSTMSSGCVRFVASTVMSFPVRRLALKTSLMSVQNTLSC